MRRTQYFLIIIISLVLSTTFAEYNNGDIRLYLNGSISITNVEGVIQLFLDEKWGTICVDGFNIGSAAAACRQLGFLKAQSYNVYSKYHFQYPDTLQPIVTDVSCNDNDQNNYAKSGNLHILRCPYIRSVGEGNGCNTSQAVAVVCDSELITEDPYEGQIRLIDGNGPSTGFAEIYLHDIWGTICDKNFQQAAADSICRQIGYTNSLSYSGMESSLDTRVWIDSTHCKQSQQCFSTQCINYPSSSKGITSGPCANHSLDLFINCTFDTDNSGGLPSGNVFECTISKVYILPLILGTVLGSLFLIILIFIILCCLCCFYISTCPLYAYREKRKYDGLI